MCTITTECTLYRLDFFAARKEGDTRHTVRNGCRMKNGAKALTKIIKEPRAFYATVSLIWEKYPSEAEFIDPVQELKG